MQLAGPLPVAGGRRAEESPSSKSRVAAREGRRPCSSPRFSDATRPAPLDPNGSGSLELRGAAARMHRHAQLRKSRI